MFIKCKLNSPMFKVLHSPSLHKSVGLNLLVHLYMYRMGTSQGSSPDYFKGQSHILFKARTTWSWRPVVDHIPSRSVHL